MWDSNKISEKLGCRTSRLMFGTRGNDKRKDLFPYSLPSVLTPMPDLKCNLPTKLRQEVVQRVTY